MIASCLGASLFACEYDYSKARNRYEKEIGLLKRVRSKIKEKCESEEDMEEKIRAIISSRTCVRDKELEWNKVSNESITGSSKVEFAGVRPSCRWGCRSVVP